MEHQVRDARSIPEPTIRAFDREVMLRQAVLQIAKQHHVDLSEVDVNSEVQSYWLNLKREEEHQEAKQLAKRRRSLVWRTVGQVIPDHYRGCVPPDSIADLAQRAEMVSLIRKRVYGTTATKQALATATQMATGQVRTALLTGLTGAGKTTLVALMLRQMAFHWHQHWRDGVVDPNDRVSLDGDPVFHRLLCANRRDEAFTDVFVWTTSREIVAAQKKNAHYGSHLKKAPILVIDDLGGEPTQVNIGGVDEILWARHDGSRKLVTLLTTGYCNPAREDMEGYLEPLTARYSEAFTRRVSEPGQCVVIRCPKKEVA